VMLSLSKHDSETRVAISSFDKLRMTIDKLRMTIDKLRMTIDRLRDDTGRQAQDDNWYPTGS
ncbi:MAG: hypothetical protein WA812_02935, partial [Candidatus Cybelea sp.]